MKKAARPGFAVAAIFPAALVPIILPALQNTGASDTIRGLIAGVSLGIPMLLLLLAVTPQKNGPRLLE